MRNYLSTCIFLISTLQAADQFWDEMPLSPSTTRPSVVLDDYWNGEFQRFNREVAAAQNTSLVFFGDSITWSWSLGPRHRERNLGKPIRRKLASS